MRKLDWYRAAAQNLGLTSLIRMQLQKRFGADEQFHYFTSKHLDYPVLARRASSDIKVFNQVFVEREYRCLDHLNEAKLVIDLGANVGYSSAYFLSRFKDCTVLAVEPDPGNFTVLKRNVAPYGNRCYALQNAVWWQSEALRFKHPMTAGDEWARVVEPGNSQDSDIRAITIPMLLKSAPFPRVSILKIDIEGAEVELFSHDTSWLECVDNVVIELHGDACREAFLRAVCPWTMMTSTCGELTYAVIKTGATTISSTG